MVHNVGLHFTSRFNTAAQFWTLWKWSCS
jgi:hypothetical protein